MLGVLINLVIVLLIVGVVWWAITALLPLIPLPAPTAQIVNVLLIVIFALIIIFYILIPLLHTAGMHTTF
jgi:hypothetical protein